MDLEGNSMHNAAVKEWNLEKIQSPQKRGTKAEFTEAAALQDFYSYSRAFCFNHTYFSGHVSSCQGTQEPE